MVGSYRIFRGGFGVVNLFAAVLFRLTATLKSLRPCALAMRSFLDFSSLLVEKTVHFTSEPYSFLVIDQAGLGLLFFLFGVHVLEMVFAHAIPSDFKHSFHFIYSHWVLNHWIWLTLTSTIQLSADSFIHQMTHFTHYCLLLLFGGRLLLLCLNSWSDLLQAIEVFNLNTFQLLIQFFCFIKKFCLQRFFPKRTARGCVYFELGYSSISVRVLLRPADTPLSQGLVCIRIVYLRDRSLILYLLDGPHLSVLPPVNFHLLGAFLSR